MSEARGEVSWRLRTTAAAACILLTLAQLFVQFPSVARHTRPTGRDLEVYYRAAQDVLAGRSPYTPAGQWSLDRTPQTYLYPPAFAAAIAPLGWLSTGGFYRVWLTLLELCLWVFCFCLVRVGGERRWWRGALLVGLVGFSPLLGISFALGQADLLVCALCAVGVVLAVLGRPAGAALAVAAGASVKVYPALMLVPLARRWGWRPPLIAVIALAGAAALTLAWLGTAPYRDFVSEVVPVVSQGTLNEANASPAAMLARGLVRLGWIDPGLPPPPWLRATFSLLSLLTLALVGWLCWRLPTRLALPWAAALSALLGPISWGGYWALFLLPAAAWWSETVPRSGPRPPALAALLGFAGVALSLAALYGPLWLEAPLAVLLVFAGISYLRRRAE